MNKQILTKTERHEPFFVTLGRLKTAIHQADYSPAHKVRALELFAKVETEIHDVASELVEVHTRLTATDVHNILSNHDCTNGPEDGCEVCSAYLPEGGNRS